MNKYEKQTFNLKAQRDKAIVNEISILFDKIRMETRTIANNISDKVNENENYLKEYGRNEKLAKEMNTTLRPTYLKKDSILLNIYEQEYLTSYMESLYSVVNTGIEAGYLLKLPTATAKQFKQSLLDPLSKLTNPSKMKTSRSVDIEQLYTTIVNGVESGQSLPMINKAIDINLGYRDSSTGDWISKKVDRKGQQYRTMRTLRTEVLRMRATAETDQWLNQQPFVPSKLKLIAVRDNRTRGQSARMDGQISNDKGQFLYPDGKYHYPHRTGIAKYDINDREYTITIDPEYPPESIIERDPKTGKNKIVPYRSFEDYAADKGLVQNKYGEYLYPEKK